MWFGVSPRARRSAATAGTTLVLVGCLAALWVALPAQTVGPTASPIHGRGCAEPFQGLRSSDVTYLVATPLADTVRDPAAAPSGYGQLAEVSHAGGGAVEVLLPHFEDDSRVVFVPWGFDDRCRPIAWTGPWRWATIGAVGFYRGRLRPADSWIGGHPTFDVDYAVWEGFPESPWEHPLGAGRRHLSADELFELYERLPTREALATRPYGAVSELVEWRHDAGDVLERYPARTLLEAAFRTADLVRLRTTHLPYAGTYRVGVVGSEGDSLGGFLLRTGAVGSEPLDVGTASREGVPTAPVPASTFAVAAALASNSAGLAAITPRDEAESGTGGACFRPLGLRAAAEETVPEDATRAWSAELSLSFVAGCFPGSSPLDELRPAEGLNDGPDVGTDGQSGPEGASRPPEDGAIGGRTFTGAFRQESDGRFTFRQPATLPDGRIVQFVGTRVETTSLPDPPALPPRLR